MNNKKLDKLLRKRPKDQGSKNPDNWPVCIACHLFAPEASYPLDARDPSKGRAPDLTTWGYFEVPGPTAQRVKHPICANCCVAVALKLTQMHNAEVTKLKLLDKRAVRGIRAELEAKLAAQVARYGIEDDDDTP